MRAIQHFTIITAAIITTLAATQIASAEAISRMSSRFLTRGELALLEVCISGAAPSSIPQIPIASFCFYQLYNIRAATFLLGID